MKKHLRYEACLQPALNIAVPLNDCIIVYQVTSTGANLSGSRLQQVVRGNVGMWPQQLGWNLLRFPLYKPRTQMNSRNGHPSSAPSASPPLASYSPHSERGVLMARKNSFMNLSLSGQLELSQLPVTTTIPTVTVPSYSFNA